MQRQHKVAVARIFSDIIKADNIIDLGEMECWDRICSRYGLDRDLIFDSRRISFAEALQRVCESDERALQDDLMGDCRQMALSDGYCAPSEALVMLAVIMMLDRKSGFRADVMSIPRAEFNVEVGTLLYIESEYDAKINETFSQRYRQIFREFQLAGLDLVYLPRIIEHYRHTDKELLTKVLAFLAPGISAEGIENIMETLLTMTTATFCKDLLCNKCGMSQLRNTYPSLLIKTGTGMVDGIEYSNYLQIELGEDLMERVEELTDLYSSMLSRDISVVRTSEEGDRQFQYYGFYRELLNLFLSRKNVRSNVLIDTYKDEIVFPEIDAKATGMHRRERALYILLLCVGREGLNFDSPAIASRMGEYGKRMDRMQKQYEAIYRKLGGDGKVPDIRVAEIRRPIMSCLRRSLRELPSLYNPDDYNVTRDDDGTFRVHLDSELVYIRTLDGSGREPLKGSELYNDIMQIR